MSDPALVCCRTCGQFIADAVGDGGGLGRCRVYEDALASGVGRDGLRDLLAELGANLAAPVFWGGALCDRVCAHYAPADNNNTGGRLDE